MNAERQQAIGDLCMRALEMDPSEREAFLQGACGDDELRLEVESLLAASDYADDLFHVPAALLPVFGTERSEETAAPGIGQEVGPYRLLERLGEGGMGVVYRATQREPVRREVALKIIRPGMDSALVAARFGAERQALALMDHPNIARVLDAGTTASDNTYFVMELVRGEPITRYCDTHRLTLRQRVQLMVPVCQAIQHAHQKGIIHRDVKPTNILVGDEPNGPVPKVIDFGIAKAIGTSLHEGATFTSAFDIIGTLEYMSPEQAEPGGRGVDVRSDVYSLGAVFYELLAGAPPVARLPAGHENGLASLLKRIQQETPQPPSQRARDNKQWQLARECDWIALKALEKDPERRYESAGAMARDLERFLDGEPVEAGPPSRLYRLGKFALRRRAWIATAAVFILVLVAATVVSVGQAARALRAEQVALQQRDRAGLAEQTARLAERAARAERDRALGAEADMRRANALTLQEKSRADSEAATSRAVASFLENDLLTQASPSAQAGPTKAPDPNLTVRTVLDRSAAALAGKFHDAPAVRASLEHTIANAYFDLGLIPQAREHALQAVELRKKTLGVHHPQTVASLDRLAFAYRSESQFAAAEKIWTELYQYQRTALGESHPDTLRSMHSLAALYRSQGKYPQAAANYERVFKLRRQLLGPEDPETMRTANNLAYTYSFLSRHKEATAIHEENLALRRRVLGPEHPETLISMSNLALSYQIAGAWTRRAPRSIRCLQRNVAFSGPPTQTLSPPC
jgi:tRNA A-37 threonylcarbamoyl transferase component Bud32